MKNILVQTTYPKASAYLQLYFILLSLPSFTVLSPTSLFVLKTYENRVFTSLLSLMSVI